MIRAIGTCTLCGEEFIVEANVETITDGRLSIENRAVYRVTVDGEAVTAAIDSHLDNECPAAAGLRGDPR